MERGAAFGDGSLSQHSGFPVIGPAGYSGTPLEKKLGLKDGQAAAFVDLPESLAGLAGARNFASVRRAGANETESLEQGLDMVLAFSSARANLERWAPALRMRIARDGAVWICWPKKASKVVSDVSEDIVREIFLPTGLVDVKVCAVDEVWSGLKLVIRKELR